MENKRGKIVAVIAERNTHDVLKQSMIVTNHDSPKAEMIDLWLDCLRPRALTEHTMPHLLTGFQHPDSKRFPTIVSIRHLGSVPPERRYFEGFKGDAKDWDRTDLMRKAVEFNPTYLELEHTKRKSIIFDPNTTGTIIRYSDFSKTPSYDELRVIFGRYKKKRSRYS